MSAPAADKTIAFRPISDDDLEFLHRVYAETRREELSVTPWTEEEKRTFLRLQAEAQHRHYQLHYTGSDFLVILVDGVPSGRLYVGRWSKEIRVVDIALLPEARGSGVGTRILKDLLDEGARTGRCVTIHVERMNPALRLYERLGFVVEEDKGIYLFMKWSPVT